MEQTQDLLVREVRQELVQEAEQVYQKFAHSLLPGVNNLLGVRLKTVRKLAKAVAKRDPLGYLSARDCIYFEEEMIRGMVIGYAPLTNEERRGALRLFVPSIGNWSVCDSCCATWHFMREEQEEWWNFLTPYFASDEEFEVRFAMVCGICYFVREEYRDAFYERLNAFRHTAYYARMAAAWAVSVLYVHFPEETGVFLTQDLLDDYTHDKAIQKIRESRHVTRQEKDALLCCKRGGRNEVKHGTTDSGVRPSL